MAGILSVVVLWLAVLLSTTAAGAVPRSPYDPGPGQPFGRANPEAPEELAQFAFLIGRNDCTEKVRGPSGGDWIERERTWDAHYALNGWAILDNGVSAAGANGNMRIFDTSDGRWKVSFFSTPGFGNGLWEGGMRGPDMVLERPQKAPGTALDGTSRLTFSAITDASFNWQGEWISQDGSVIYPFWTISCHKTSS